MSQIVFVFEAFAFIFTVSTLMSYAFGVTPVFRFTASLNFGIAVGFTIVTTLRNIYNLGILKVIQGNYIYVLWILIGAIAILRVIPRFFIFCRPAMAYVYGISMAVMLRGVVYTELVGAFAKWATYSLSDPATIMLYFGLVCCLSYFVWSRKLSIHDRGRVGIIPLLGRWLFLFSFGEQMLSLGFKRYGVWTSLLADIIGHLKTLGIPIP